MITKQKIGIVCDHYKVEKFKEELNKAGIEIVSILPDKSFTLITVFDHQSRVKPITDNVTQYFIDHYKTNN